MLDIAKFLLIILLLGHPEAGVKLPQKQVTIAPVKKTIVQNVQGKSQVIDNMVVLVNQKRSEVGLKPLVENGKLFTSAKNKACDVYNKGYWSHINPDGKMWEFFLEAGYNYTYAGENICRIGNDNGCINAFMESPTHKANIINVNYKEIGIGRCGNILVQHFGAR